MVKIIIFITLLLISTPSFALSLITNDGVNFTIFNDGTNAPITMSIGDIIQKVQTVGGIYWLSIESMMEQSLAQYNSNHGIKSAWNVKP